MIGIDIVEIERITKLKERFGDKAFAKFLTPEEIALANSDTTIAGFYAAKEAVSKALGIGISEKCGFFDIKLSKDSKNAPSFTLSRHLIEDYEITDLSLSITHDNGFAIAVVVIEGKKSNRQLWH
ncbi:holo-ACP synthase [Sulfurospirillum diekertiae]|uniref:Holo-[acyl-carrier-protein] synthase n=1 Tax=Sulfurospirillum diekertiae TaxID=1854492 RepID=A0A6G9VVF7_9BACT|nr:holo-ACP synthase [Sulfurospirillum diekertiae]QIR76929.1 holo-ACP synthase [Sulfurospirillum diekertiae]QIR79546.1 holo-ACP synthase [Sulfurospirillum diekertiae]